jgi:iron-sulfur cluster assembly protein
MITVTENAKKKAINLMEEDGKTPSEAFIRVGVKGGGCSGLSYELTFDTDLKQEDKVFEHNGIRVVVDKKSFLYLIGTELDYSGGLNGKGFIFTVEEKWRLLSSLKTSESGRKPELSLKRPMYSFAKLSFGIVMPSGTKWSVVLGQLWITSLRDSSAKAIGNSSNF